MKQIFHNVGNGLSYLEEVPVPHRFANSLLIKTNKTLISSGTERTVVEFGKQSLLQKARSNPEKVKRVLQKVKTQGLKSTIDQVFSTLEEPVTSGYCNVGQIIELDEGNREFKVHDRVVSNGPHAEYVVVGQNLCAKIPDDVSDEEAVFTVLGSIGLQGIRLVNPSIGETVFVIGLGLIGLLTVQILIANGCQVIGSDFNRQRIELAKRLGCETVDLSTGVNPVETAMSCTNGRGVDAVVITAATKSPEPVHQAAQMCRKRGHIVLVGVAGLELNRDDFYAKELTFQVSCSYGPGRYDANYELKGQDYPFGYVRWTEKRNFETILHLMSQGKLQVEPLITHRFPIERVDEAFSRLTDDESALGIILDFTKKESKIPAFEELKKTIEFSLPAENACRIGIIGAGSFTTGVLLPALKKVDCSLISITSLEGYTSTLAARKFHIAKAEANSGAIISDNEVNTIFITTRHDSHAELACKALRARKNVFVEKPLAIDIAGLKAIVAEIKEISQKGNIPLTLMVGFNRRFSPHITKMKKLLDLRMGPACISYNVNPGYNSPDSWTQDPKVGGGRIIGEGCHFIDIIKFLVGKAIVSVYAQQVENFLDGVCDDKMSIMLKFADGSIGTVNYWANGATEYMKEQIFAFADTKILRMDNFQLTSGWGYRNFTRFKTSKSEKGHQEEVKAFCDLVRNGGNPLIAYEELLEVTLGTFMALESAKSNKIQLMSEWKNKLVSQN